MTERYGSGYGDEGGQRPSGRGAVTERLARQERVNEIDLTDETTQRESSGTFESAETTRPGSSSIFDVDERARQEDQNRTGTLPVAVPQVVGDVDELGPGDGDAGDGDQRPRHASGCLAAAGDSVDGCGAEHAQRDGR